MTWQQAAEAASRNAVCAILNASDSANQYAQTLGFPGNPGVQVANGLRRTVCNGNPAGDNSETPPQFPNGQCTGTQYSVFIEWEGEDEFGNPISGTAGSAAGAAGFGPVGTVRTAGPSDEFQNILQGTIALEANGPPVLQTYGGPGGANTITDFSVTVTPLFGGIDNCGGPGPDIPPFPPSGFSSGGDLIYDDDDGNQVTEPFELTINAPISVSPTLIYSPITFSAGNIDFNGTLKLAPEFKLELSPQFGNNSAGEGGNDVPPSPDDPPVDSGTVGSVVIGVRISANPGPASVSTEIDQQGGPSLYVPRLGNCYFLVRIAGVSAWVGPIDVKQRSAYIPCPEPRGAIGATVIPEPGVELSFGLIRGPAIATTVDVS